MTVLIGFVVDMQGKVSYVPALKLKNGFLSPHDSLFPSKGKGSVSYPTTGGCMRISQSANTWRSRKVTVFLSEQNRQVALRLSNRGYIIDNGVIQYEGTIEVLKGNEEITRKFFFTETV